jgi:hypothetical protein
MLFLCAGEKCQVRRIPITVHESVKVVAIPGLLLCPQNVFNFGLRRTVVGKWNSVIRQTEVCRPQHWQEKSEVSHELAHRKSPPQGKQAQQVSHERDELRKDN